ncbi:unnamed protein product [Darwinula stevensoni]|uniref:Beta-galactoside alpha-2,6-sialyltransferase 1 n=1 Tax=Darwinula stevensoni TaxID=69355 RepID=A0A7R9A6D8_9CRUS|nr:unnamed protein product [Darwinula stevensoni]CAG0888868.1 unnamed protein product [Darwinula stevensoni]
MLQALVLLKMRIEAFSLWMFVNMMFLGMWCYVYILWVQYWRYIETHPVEWGASSGANANNSGQQHPINPFGFPEEMVDFIVHRHHNINASSDSEDHLKLTLFKSQLLIQMRNALITEAKDHRNPYGVTYHEYGKSVKKIRTMRRLMCDLGRVGLRTLLPKDEPFHSMGMGNLLQPSNILDGVFFNTCAVVTNAGSLKDSRMGEHIDSHDAVVRFNHAPTSGYVKDVGKKTTIRIVNSQILTKPRFEFMTSPLYRNVTLLTWDPSKYKASLTEWYGTPEHDLFTEFFHMRVVNPDLEFFLLHPEVMWELWEFLQRNTPSKILRNPPSSGFLGVALMLHHCKWVDVYEYVPSMRLTPRCYYFDKMEDVSCTLGGWHPLATEKLLALAMSTASDHDVFRRGFLRLKGFSQVNCP